MKKIILALVFVLPFIIIPKAFFPMVYGKSLFFESVNLILIAFWVIDKIYNKNKNIISSNLPIIILGIYVLLFLISGIAGSTPSLSFWGSMDHGIGGIFMLNIFIFTLMLSSLFRNDKDWYELFSTFVVSGIFFTIGGILSHVGFKFSSIIGLDIYSGFTIGNSSWAGIYVAFVFFISLGLALSAKNNIQRIIGITGLIFAFFDPTLTGFIFHGTDVEFGFIGLAKTGSYSVFFGLFLFGLYLIYRKIKSVKFKKVYVITILSLVIASSIAIIFIGFSPIKNLVATNAGPNRLVFWDIAVKGFKEKPLLGWGSDTYQFVYAKYFNPIILTPGYAPEYWVDRAHNFYFDEIQAGGALGFIGLVSLYAVLLFSLIKKALNDLSVNGLMYMALFSGIISYLIQGLMIFQNINGWFMIAILVAYSSSNCFKDRKISLKIQALEENGDSMRLKNLMSIFVVLVFVVLLRYVVLIPLKINSAIGNFPNMAFVERITFLTDLDSAYLGNITDIGNIFAPYHLLLRRNVENGLSPEDQKVMIYELNAIDKVLENGLKRSNYGEMKVLMSAVGMHSLLIDITIGADRERYYNEGMFYVEKMKLASPENPIAEQARVLLDLSLDTKIDDVIISKK